MNNYIKTALSALSLVLVFGCEKDLSPGTSDFGVSVEKKSFSIRDTAHFTFSGNPDVITFYSGEPGSRYEYRGRAEAEGNAVMSFRTIRANGSQPNSLNLMISQDFAGVVKGDTASTKANISAANWTPITSRATLSTGGSSAVSSGDINLSDFAEENKPVFIAFKYMAEAGSIQNKWTISNFSVRNVLPDGTSYEIANMNTSTTAYKVYGVDTFSPGIAAYTLQNKYNWNVGTTSLIITGATTVTAADAVAESWAFVGPVNLRKVVPDIGKAVKNPTQKLDDFTFHYQYKTPGKYTSIFVGSKNSINGSSGTVKSLEVEVSD
ncbi:DUF5017 domain-containing protein [Desertivirga xinjiangensis]|uniref:DUF5017 domain-containing protein n=1 Tax=Desertivirga xinjiangensis TaxID=539206 RepID=UPI002108F19E|nr:DUF5017 domain-containing protein [Pedobacter xinjiangensis]